MEQSWDLDKIKLCQEKWFKNMTRLEFYEQFPGTIVFTENRGWLNLGLGKYTEFQIYNDDTMEFVHNKFGELTEEQETTFEKYLEIIKILQQ